MTAESRRVGAFLACLFAGGAILSAYLPLWLADRGIDAAVIGEVLGLASALRVVGVPACGWASDRLGRHRLGLFLAAATAFACMGRLPATDGLTGVAALVILGGVASTALPAIADAMTLALAAAKRLDYGPTRAWGSIAYMLAAAAAGALLGRVGSGVVPLLLASCYGAAALLTPALPAIETQTTRTLRPAPLGASFRWALLATALIQGSHAAYYAFASLHWRHAGIADVTIGLLIAEGIVAEIALFLWGRRLVDWLGPAGLTAVSALACVLRWTVLAATVSVPALAAAQLLHAATFAFQHLSSMWVLRSLPAARAGWAQTVMSAIGFSAPTGLLTWIAGLLYADWGGRIFLLMALVGGLAILVTPFLPAGARRRSG